MVSAIIQKVNDAEFTEICRNSNYSTLTPTVQGPSEKGHFAPDWFKSAKVRFKPNLVSVGRQRVVGTQRLKSEMAMGMGTG